MKTKMKPLNEVAGAAGDTEKAKAENVLQALTEQAEKQEPTADKTENVLQSLASQYFAAEKRAVGAAAAQAATKQYLRNLLVGFRDNSLSPEEKQFLILAYGRGNNRRR
jgi:hypothetical protein